MGNRTSNELNTPRIELGTPKGSEIFDTMIQQTTGCLIHKEDSDLNLNRKSIIKQMNIEHSDTPVDTYFIWQYGGNDVYLIGSFCNWQTRIKMERHGNEFNYVLKLPKGMHYFKFIVDNEWRFAPDKPTMTDSTGNINNYIDTTNFESENLERDDLYTDTHGYSKEIPNLSDFHEEPPPLYNQYLENMLDIRKKVKKQDLNIGKNIEYIKNELMTEENNKFLSEIYSAEYPKPSI